MCKIIDEGEDNKEQQNNEKKNGNNLEYFYKRVDELEEIGNIVKIRLKNVIEEFFEKETIGKEEFLEKWRKYGVSKKTGEKDLPFLKKIKFILNEDAVNGFYKRNKL